jgi:hypothetical protein
MTETAPLPDADWDMAAARAKLAPKHDSSKKARQTRQKRIAKAVDRSARDGRSLRSTGRGVFDHVEVCGGVSISR